MGITLKRLQSVGPDLPPAEVIFHPKRYLIRGPSETGKSYIRDCLWYLLGGDKLPKRFPLSEGYQELSLRFESERNEYEVRRALAGGAAAVYSRSLSAENDQSFEPIDEDIGELLIKLSGAEGKQILRSQSEKGAVTGDDVRHWSLLSQTTILSEEPTAGDGFGVTKRVASFNLFLSGNDDAAIQLRKSTAEVERIKGQLSSAESAYVRIQAGLPKDAKRDDVAEALDRVDRVLSAMADQYEAMTVKLKQMRRDIADSVERLSKVINARDHSETMISRFELIEKKYTNDIARLSATDEGVAFFEALPSTPCPLCQTPVESQPDPADLQPNAPQQYRDAIAAEIEKMRMLKEGLSASLVRERLRFGTLTSSAEQIAAGLKELQHREALALNDVRIEFSADPKTLAIRRSELSSQLSIFDEMERLAAEIERLKKAKMRSRIQVDREGGTSGRDVADMALGFLSAWGLTDIQNISLDAEQCDLVLNDRPRLSYGAGRRALYLAALTIALMEHALDKGHPHLGTVVIDSPLKAYADPISQEAEQIPLATVTNKFYDWLASWDGKGQVIILENEALQPATSAVLDALEFSGLPGVGRPGFYPLRVIADETPGEGEASSAK